jgi:hypothetical protein
MLGGGYAGGLYLGGGPTALLGSEEVEPGGPLSHERILTPLGEQMRDSLPPVLRESSDYLAVINSLSRECERCAAVLEIVRKQFVPSKADLLLGVWERLTRQTIEPVGKTLAERQAAVTARLRKMLSLGQGKSWEEEVTLLFGVGWSYEEHKASDPKSPPEGVLRIKLPFGPEDDRYLRAVSELREITPAHLELTFSAEGGFILDKSRLDIEELTI